MVKFFSKNINKKRTILERHRFSLKTPARPHSDNDSRTNPVINETVKTTNLIELSR